MTLYLSRLRLSRAPSARALDAILNPEDPGQRLDAHHRLLWAVFCDHPDRERDFLWREEKAGEFLTLSARPPAPSELFEEPQVKEFAPQLAVGARLAFALRANATREKKGIGRVDVVMDRLKPIPGQMGLPKDEKSERPALRHRLATEAAREWLAGQGLQSGFVLGERRALDGSTEPDLDVHDYSVAALPGHRGRRKGQPQFGILDMTGVLEVADPAAFLARLARGFGRAKAFGCGLMLIRRAG